jgi:hypothetical protein
MLKTTLLSLCGLVFAVGCGSKGGDAAQCSAAAEKGVTTMQNAVKARAPSTATPEQVAQITDGIGKLKDVLVKHCTEDKWPKDVIDCYGNASSQQEFKACREKLPKDAADKLRADEMQVMSSMMGAMGGMRGHGMRMGGGSGMGAGGDSTGSAVAAPAPVGSAVAPAPAPTPAPAPAGSAH